MGCEEEFGIAIPQELAERLSTVGDVVACVEEQQADGAMMP